MKVSYSVDDYGTMTIFVNNKSVAEISECKRMNSIQKETLVTEILSDLGYKV